jgi:limonene-1,2-epoxide hydrolase
MANKIEAVRAMESAAFSGNWDKFKSYLADDVYYRVGNTAEVRGPQAVVDYLINSFFPRLAITDLQTRAAWQDGNTVMLELNMAGHRVKDKKNISYPCIDVFRFKGDKIGDWRVYAIEPAFIK